MKATSSPSLLAALPRVEAKLREGSTLTQAIGELGVLDASALGTLTVAEMTGTLDETLERMSVELQESSLRASRFLILVVTAMIGAVLLFKIVAGMLGVILGPIKQMYDDVGSGKFDR